MDLIFCAGSRVESAATRFAGCLRQGGNAPHPSICFVHKDASNRCFVVNFFEVFLANSSCDKNCHESTRNGRLTSSVGSAFRGRPLRAYKLTKAAAPPPLFLAPCTEAERPLFLL